MSGLRIWTILTMVLIAVVNIFGESVDNAEFFEATVHPETQTGDCRAVLVVLTGVNGDSKCFFAEPQWVEFAKTNKIALVAATFRSSIDKLKAGGGYYKADLKSGTQLIEFLKSSGLARKPLLLYGFSGGAHFAASFAEWYPATVVAWCAASAGWWDKVNDDKINRPPGVVMCGTEDPRYGACLSHFQQGRAAGRKWTWVGIPSIGHSRNVAAEDFVRNYFAEIIASCGRKIKPNGVWVDIATGEIVENNTDISKSNMFWLPSGRLIESWRSLTGKNEVEILRRAVKSQQPKQATLTMFLRKLRHKPSTCVLCLCLLANNVNDIPAMIMNGHLSSSVGRMIEFAERNNLAVIAWGSSRHLWNPRKNWTELTRQEMREADRKFDLSVEAWKKGVAAFIHDRRIPDVRFLLWGYSGSAQYAQRLALRMPERFLAVNLHIPSSFDVPTTEGASILWCLTTGENESGYERSLEFFKATSAAGYPILYKAYPGLAHTEHYSAEILGRQVLQMALNRERTEPSFRWHDNWLESPLIGDVVNQRVVMRSQMDEIPFGYRVMLPDEQIADTWKRD